MRIAYLALKRWTISVNVSVNFSHQACSSTCILCGIYTSDDDHILRIENADYIFVLLHIIHASVYYGYDDVYFSQNAIYGITCWREFH